MKSNAAALPFPLKTANRLFVQTLAIGMLLLFAARATFAADRTVPPPLATSSPAPGASAILTRLAEAWRGAAEMPIAEEMSFAIRVAGEGGGSFTIALGPAKGARVTVGIAPEVKATFVTDIATLRAIGGGEMSAMTAMARARGGDPAPLTVEFPKGFRWTPALQALYLPLTFHFFNPGVPEVIRFGDGTARPVHGGLSSIFYYDRGLRTSWYQLASGMHINAGAGDQSNPFSSLVIVTRGAMRSRIGGIDRVLREGEAVLIPASVAHEFWAAKGEYAEFILVMFGEEA